MKLTRLIISLFLSIALLALPLSEAAGVFAQVEPEFEIEAEAALLMETNSGKIIWEENSKKKLYPASLTKIMTLLLALEKLAQGQISLGDQVCISARASSMGGSEIFLSEGDVVSLENLLIGMAVGSANDAAVAVAEHISGSVEGFVELMNEKAKSLGLQQTHFCNPHGLHNPDHYSCAYDVMLMSLALLEYPRIHQWATIWMDEHFLKGRIRSGEVFLSNTNRMIIDYPGCDGLKTGFTREAGNGISATAQRGKSRFLAVVMGSPTEKERYDAARMLLDYGFSNYKSVPVVKKEAVVTVLPVEKGSPPELEVIAAENLSLLLPRDADESYTKEVQIFPLELPLKQYQKVGELTVRYGENEQTTVDLLVHEELQRAPVGAMFLRLLQRWLRFGR
ncbi:MAG: D-alanyl-D-alanine carboxypeptidase family protein [Dethiobacteria bacterium]|nr:D-alanyl-D-alanine carboxypeptidase family protein [Bacillota bacterium]NMD33222.1 D-alanyl-D-alanine carboxypeptidase [Bacillota bacterium]HOB28371.1 D-alanyl-D-alanine carboxypeptidase family protein [Bacillota bacterium]HPZ41251.1 D-alanyl-D-alanine carboxypeptidase family protein [Bacillota bacterium]HQD51920.1 D-alanyl-D-alanine carboxypeptidase family protein [Bacillota bacterium]